MRRAILTISVPAAALALSLINSTHLLWVTPILAVIALILGRGNAALIKERLVTPQARLWRMLPYVVLLLLSYSVGFYRLMEYPRIPAGMGENQTIFGFHDAIATAKYDHMHFVPVAECLTQTGYLSYFYGKYLFFMWNHLHTRMSEVHILRLSNMIIAALVPALCYCLFMPVFGVFVAFLGGLTMVFLPIYIYYLHQGVFSAATLSVTLFASILITRILTRRGNAFLLFLPIPFIVVVSAHLYAMLHVWLIPMAVMLVCYSGWALVTRRMILLPAAVVLCVALLAWYHHNNQWILRAYFRGGGETIHCTITVHNPLEYKRYLIIGGYNPEAMDLLAPKTHLIAVYIYLKTNINHFTRMLFRIQTCPVDVGPDAVPYCLPPAFGGFLLIGFAAYLFQYREHTLYWLWFFATAGIIATVILLSWSTAATRMQFLLPFFTILSVYGMEICRRQFLAILRGEK